MDQDQMVKIDSSEVELVKANRKISAMLRYMKRTGSNEASAYAWIQSEAKRLKSANDGGRRVQS
jgi:hypothetical protein